MKKYIFFLTYNDFQSRKILQPTTTTTTTKRRKRIRWSRWASAPTSSWPSSPSDFWPSSSASAARSSLTLKTGLSLTHSTSASSPWRPSGSATLFQVCFQHRYTQWEEGAKVTYPSTYVQVGGFTLPGTLAKKIIIFLIKIQLQSIWTIFQP